MAKKKVESEEEEEEQNSTIKTFLFCSILS